MKQFPSFNGLTQQVTRKELVPWYKMAGLFLGLGSVCCMDTGDQGWVSGHLLGLWPLPPNLVGLNGWLHM